MRVSFWTALLHDVSYFICHIILKTHLWDKTVLYFAKSFLKCRSLQSCYKGRLRHHIKYFNGQLPNTLHKRHIPEPYYLFCIIGKYPFREERIWLKCWIGYLTFFSRDGVSQYVSYLSAIWSSKFNRRVRYGQCCDVMGIMELEKKRNFDFIKIKSSSSTRKICKFVRLNKMAIIICN